MGFAHTHQRNALDHTSEKYQRALISLNFVGLQKLNDNKKAARVNALTAFALAAFSIAIFNAYADEKFKDI